MDNQNFEIKIGEEILKIKTNSLAEQANGSALVQYGETLVLVTAVMSKQERKGLGFFPLTVDYEERFYAAGKILGSRYIRRESRPSDEAILTARLIDRAIRPRFPKSLKRDVQVVITCLSWDGKNDPDVLGLLGASLALSISDIPWQGPLAVLRIGKTDEDFIVNPNYEQREKSSLDLILASMRNTTDDVLINMIESEAKETDETTILDAVQSAKPYLNELIDFQNEIVKKVGKEKAIIEGPSPDPELEKTMREFLDNQLEKAFSQPKKQDRMDEISDLKEKLVCLIENKYSEEKITIAQDFFEEEVEQLIHKKILTQEQRPDNRKLDEIRQISAEAGLLPRAHGSGLFARGQTKALSILTLGAPGDQKLSEGMEVSGKKRFMHHYNFPPYSVGEVRPMRGPGRRDIGHGMLAEKALTPIIPSFEEFPYTIRVVSEIVSSNGSSSMASVCASSMALMDAGVPIKKPVAGIAMGIISDKNDFKILTDIQGPEDHYGDMDLKVAGTKDGITAIQMDVKIEGVTPDILGQALSQAKNARFQILDMMEKVLPKPRPELAPTAPKILTIQINPEKIREVIGPGGKIINEIIDKCGVSVDIEDSGIIFVTAEDKTAAEKAVDWIKNITREVKVGEMFQGTVKRILAFGAFVEILPGQEGMVHISELDNRRVDKVEDVVNIGDTIPVKVISVDDQGRINLSLKQAKEIKG